MKLEIDTHNTSANFISDSVSSRNVGAGACSANACRHAVNIDSAVAQAAVVIGKATVQDNTKRTRIFTGHKRLDMDSRGGGGEASKSNESG